MALSEAVRSRGRDPKIYDPWYFPSVEDYTKVWAQPVAEGKSNLNRCLLASGRSKLRADPYLFERTIHGDTFGFVRLDEVVRSKLIPQRFQRRRGR